MTKSETEEHRQRLEKERGRLLEELKRSEKREDFGSDIDPDKEADEAESFSTNLAIGYGLRERINEIEAALNKLHEGKFGNCESCGKEISKKILDASPATRFCLDCKKNLAR